MPKKFPIVGIGASAGGIEALELFFKTMPADPGMAFVLVTHLPHGRVSLLPDIIGRSTTLPVLSATDDTDVESNHVYVMPADVVLELKGGKLNVRSEGSVHATHPIDVFFASLATDQEDSAIGIVLSGSGSDGSLGIKAIKEAGGLTLAQGGDGSGPRHSSMPASAIATGLVDMVLPVEQMPVWLVDFAKRREGHKTGVEQSESSGNLAEIQGRISSILLKQLGHDFSGYKEKPFVRRVTRRMEVLQLENVEGYVEHLRRSPAEAKLLMRDLMIGVTNFFRDPSAFTALETVVIPRLFADHGMNDSIRVWVPGCSTGEEVYTLAILLREHTKEGAPHIQIFATDIDESALAVARAGRYATSVVEGVTPERLARFFINDGGVYAVSKELREMCIFSAHSIIRDPPFSRIDLISCRNLLIYLGSHLQAEVAGVFHYALRPGGFLFLGTSETLSQYSDLFAPVDKKQRIFQRRDHIEGPRPAPLSTIRHKSTGTGAAPGRDPAVHSAPPNFRRAVDNRVLDRFAPAHVVVNHDGDVVYYSGRTGKYLEPAQGAPNRQLLSMARRGLRLDLRPALQEALEKRQTVVKENLSVDADDRSQVIDLIIEPLPGFESDPLFIVIFQDVGLAIPSKTEPAPEAGPEGGAAAAERLEQELRDTRERLQAMIEEYETSLEELKAGNEELTSLNEELQSTNEELETSKEEIQSVNEELSTVNLELHRKVDELDRANADLRNLYESTQVATIFLDAEGLIRNFTPAVTQLFNLLPGDRGRPLTDIASHLELNDLPNIVDEVLKTGKGVTRQVQRRSDHVHFLMRVLPYWSSAEVLDGVVLTFVDVTQLAEAEAQQKMLVEELNHRVKNMLTVITSIANRTFAPDTSAPKDAFMGRVHALAKTYGLISKENWQNVSLQDLVTDGLAPYEEGQRVSVKGPPIWLTPRAALAIGLVLHELATNAVKHGTLSTAKGRLSLTWRVERQPKPGQIVIEWTETGGPKISKPLKKGFGTELISKEFEYQLGGKANLQFSSEGLKAVLELPCTPELVVLGC
jgi:two-component system, chemotaxis family, CheB/CheR fusion protein